MGVSRKKIREGIFCKEWISGALPWRKLLNRQENCKFLVQKLGETLSAIGLV
jgi:hypothetical protein